MPLPPSQYRRRKQTKKLHSHILLCRLQNFLIPRLLTQKKVIEPQQCNVTSFSCKISFGIEKIPPMHLLQAALVNTGAQGIAIKGQHSGLSLYQFVAGVQS